MILSSLFCPSSRARLQAPAPTWEFRLQGRRQTRPTTTLDTCSLHSCRPPEFAPEPAPTYSASLHAKPSLSFCLPSRANDKASNSNLRRQPLAPCGTTRTTTLTAIALTGGTLLLLPLLIRPRHLRATVSPCSHFLSPSRLSGPCQHVYRHPALSSS